MIIKIEEEFFQCFDISPKEEKYCYYECKKPEFKQRCCEDKNCEFFRRNIEYPQITDTHYLELITHLSGVTKPHFVFERGVEELKQDILIQCMNYVEVLKPFIQGMFYDN